MTLAVAEALNPNKPKRPPNIVIIPTGVTEEAATWRQLRLVARTTYSLGPIYPTYSRPYSGFSWGGGRPDPMIYDF